MVDARSNNFRLIQVRMKTRANRLQHVVGQVQINDSKAFARRRYGNSDHSYVNQ